MVEAILSAVAAIAATVGVFAAAQRLYRRTGSFLLNPTMVAIAVLIAALALLEVDYAAYERGGKVLSFFLGPAVVALGMPLALQWSEIARRGRAIAVSILAGSITGIVSGTLTALLLGAPRDVVLSLAPRAVTTPIALGIAETIGGIPPLTATLVIATGIVGAVIGPTLLRRSGVTSRTAFGLAMGAAAHGVGTARAVEEGEVEGATSGLAIGLMGVATAILAPVLVRLLLPG